MVVAEKKYSRELLSNPNRILRESYSYTNELTALLEAVSKRSVSVTHQEWNPHTKEFDAFGMSLVSMFSRGLDSLPRGQKYDIERSRRVMELREQESLNSLTQEGVLKDQMMIVVSPFPSDMSRDISEELGYFPERRVGKVRIHYYDEITGRKEIAELCFTDSSASLIKRIFEALDAPPEMYETLSESRISEVVGKKLLVNKNVYKHWSDILTVLAPILYRENGERIVQNSKVVINEAAPALDSLVGLDYELKTCVALGKPTVQLRRHMEEYYEKACFGMFNLDEMEIWLLKQGQRYFTAEVARVLMKIARVNTYSKVSALTQSGFTKNFKFNGGAIRASLTNIFDDRALNQVRIFLPPQSFSFCGQNLGPGAYFGVLFGINSEPFNCPECKYRTYSPVGNTCPSCHLTKEEYALKLKKEKGEEAETCD